MDIVGVHEPSINDIRRESGVIGYNKAPVRRRGIVLDRQIVYAVHEHE